MKRITTLVLAGAALMSLTACAGQKVEYAKFNEQAVAARRKEQSGGPKAATFEGKGKSAKSALGIALEINMACKLVYTIDDSGWHLNEEKSDTSNTAAVAIVELVTSLTADMVQEEDGTTYYVSPLQTKTETVTTSFNKYGRLAKRAVKDGKGTDYTITASWSY